MSARAWAMCLGAGVVLLVAAAAPAGAGRRLDGSPAGASQWESATTVRLPAVFRHAGLDDLPLPETAVPPTATTTTPAATATPTAPTQHTPGVPSCQRTSGDSGGFRFSMDGGATLAPNYGRLADIAYTWDLEIDPRNPDSILELHQRRLFRSADAGCTFTEIPGVPADDWDRLEVAPSAPDVLVLTSVFASRLAYSADGGQHWLVEDLPDDTMALGIDPIDPWRWTFVGRGPSIYVRTAAGERWTARTIPVEGGQSIVAAAFAPARPQRWLVASSTRGLYRTDDGGDSWVPASGGLFEPFEGSTEPTHAVVASSITFSPADPDVAYAVANQVTRTGSLRSIWRSKDGGLTWSARLHDGDVQGDATARLTGGTRVFVGPADPDWTFFAYGMAYDAYGTDLYRSNDGLLTYEASHFNGFTKVYAMAFGPQAPVVFVGASSDIPSE